VVSVVVRSGSAGTAVNGTLVARPPRMSPGIRLRRWFHPEPTVRLVFGDHRLAGKSPEGSRQPGRETRTPQRPASYRSIAFSNLKSLSVVCQLRMVICL
jgi:hypothetical protein